MNKKTLLTILGAVLAIAIYWLGFVIGVHYTEYNAETKAESIALSDEEIMNFRIIEEYGHEYYGVLYDDPRDGFIEFAVYTEDDVPYKWVSLNRDYYAAMYEHL